MVDGLHLLRKDFVLILKKIHNLTPPLALFGWIWLSLLLSLGLAWHSLAKVDFGYAIWYEYGGIKENIDKYAPKNRFKHDFESADRQQHLDSFGAIVDSIQNKGVGLAEIRYQAKEKTHTLLHKAEVIHLQDVANLIEWLNHFLFFSFILWLMILLYQFKKPFNYTTKQASSAIILGSVLLSLPIFIFGAEKVFYQFHIWIFPDDHQWFFYYQDSLMATMMKAPDIFAYIALSLVFVTLIIYILISKVLKTLQNRLK